MPDRVVLDANVLVAALYDNDSLHSVAMETINRIEGSSRRTVILDFLLLEALSVLGRRARERKTLPPNFDECVERAKEWRAASAIRDVSHLFAVHWSEVLEVMASTGGKLNANRSRRSPHSGRSPGRSTECPRHEVNDALLVALQRAGVIDDVATFDENLAAFPGFKRFA
jgi:predicted nucleic acid-binding protein